MCQIYRYNETHIYAPLPGVKRRKQPEEKVSAEEIVRLSMIYRACESDSVKGVDEHGILPGKVRLKTVQDGKFAWFEGGEGGWSAKRIMNAQRVVKLIPTLDGTGSKDARFELYCSLLREFIEPAFGWDEGFQRRRFEAEYPDENSS